MPDTFTFEEAQEAGESFSFEAAQGESFSFEEAGGPTSTLGGLASKAKAGFIRLKELPTTLEAAGVAGLDRPTVRQERRAFERAMTDPAYFAASTIPGVTPLQVESRFGPPAQLERAMTPQRELQKAITKDVAKVESKLAGLPRSEAQKRLEAASTTREQWQAWLRDPVELTAGIILESLPASLVGAGVGGMAGGATGMAAGVGVSSASMTFASELLGNARALGYDVNDPQRLQAWLNNSEDFQAAFRQAAVKSAVVGQVDAATAGAAGRFIEPALKQGLKKIVMAGGKELGIQAAGGALGEAAGALAAGQAPNTFDVAMEALAEVGSAPAEIVGNVAEGRRQTRAAPAKAGETFSFEEARKPAVAPANLPVTRDLAAELQAAMTGNQVKGGRDAGTIRSDQGQTAAGGPVQPTGQAPRGADLQRETPGQPGGPAAPRDAAAQIEAELKRGILADLPEDAKAEIEAKLKTELPAEAVSDVPSPEQSPANAPAGTPTLAPPPPEVKPKPKRVGLRARKVFDRETELQGPDILSWIAENMPLMSKSQARAQRGAAWWQLNYSLYDDAPTLKRPQHNIIYGGTSMPDQVAQAAYDAGVLDAPDANELWAAIGRGSERRSGAFANLRREEAALETQAEFARATAQGELNVSAESLQLGDTFEVEGEAFTVKRVDPQSGEVTLDDGKKFGRQYLQPGQEIWVENPAAEISEREAERFSLSEEPTKGGDQRGLQEAQKEITSKAAGQATTEPAGPPAARPTSAEVRIGHSNVQSEEVRTGHRNVQPAAMQETPARFEGRTEELDAIALDLYGREYEGLNAYERGQVQVTLEHEDARGVQARADVLPAAPAERPSDERPTIPSRPPPGAPARPVRSPAARAEVARQLDELAQEIYNRPWRNLPAVAHAYVRDQFQRGRRAGDVPSDSISARLQQLWDERAVADLRYFYSGKGPNDKLTREGWGALGQSRYIEGQLDILREIANAPPELKRKWFQAFTEADSPQALAALQREFKFALGEFQFDQPESVAQQREREKAEAQQAATKKQRAEAEQRARQRLTGEDLDTTAEMFGAEVRRDRSGQGSLFSMSAPAQTGTEHVPAARAALEQLADDELGPGHGFEVVWRPGWTHNGRMVEGALLSSGRVMLNAAARGMQDEAHARRVIREERAHQLLSSPDGQAAVRRFALEHLSEQEEERLFSQGYTGSRELLADEFIAKQARENTSVWREIVERVKAWLAKHGLATLTKDEVARAILRSLKSEGVQQRAERGERFGLEESQYRKDFLRWRLGSLPRPQSLQLGRTPEALRAAGLPDGPIYVRQETLDEKIAKHGLPPNKLARLPEALSDPILVHKSWTEPDSFVALLDLSVRGDNLAAALHFRKTSAGLDVTEIASIYPREAAQILSAIERGAVTYYHKEKIRAWLSQQSGFNSPQYWVQQLGQFNAATDTDLGQDRFSLGEPAQPDDLPAQLAAAEQELRAAIRQYMQPPEGMNKQQAREIRDAAAARLRELQRQRFQQMLTVQVDELRGNPEELAQHISETVDLLNAVLDDISQLKAASQAVPSTLNKLRNDLQTRLMVLKGWTEGAPEDGGRKPTVSSPAPGSVRRQKELEFEGATNPDRKPLSDWWDQFKRGLRWFASPVPEIPLTGEAAVRAAPFMRGLRLFKAETARVRREAAAKIGHVLEPLLTLERPREQNAALKRYMQLSGQFTRAKAQGRDDLVQRIQSQMETLEKAALKADPFNLFRLLVIYRDLWWRGTYLKTPEGKPVALPQGWQIEDVANRLQRLTAALDAHPQKAAITEALKRHYALTDALQKSILEHGEIIPEALRNPLYFPHHILDNWTGRIDRVRPSTEEDFRRYLIAPVGSGKLIQTDYLKAMYVHVADVLAHNARVDLVQKYWQRYDASPRLKENFGEDWDKPWNLPPGYKLFAPFKKLPLRMDYILPREVLAEKLGVLFNDGDLKVRAQEGGRVLKVDPEELHQALVAGEKIKWALPAEIADALEGIAKREKARANPGLGHGAGLPVRKLVNFWKKTKLFAPWNWLRYEYGNTLTDIIDKILVADPGAAKFIPQAAREIVSAERQGEKSPEFIAASKEGVFETITGSELGDARRLVTLPEFNALATAGEEARETVSRFARLTARGSMFREAVFRYAKFLADVERMKSGKLPVYAGAYHKSIEALGEEPAGQRPLLEGDDLIHAKAAEISLKTFGDYNSLSVVSQWLRQYLVPFHSWTDVNFRYHANQIRNIADGLRGIRGGTPRDVALKYAAVRVISLLAGVAAAQALWNSIGGALAGLWDDDDDLESQLSAQDRRRAHVILGKDENGKVLVAYTPSAFGDVAEWIGGNNGKRLFLEYAKGDITLEQFISDYAKQLPADFINKLAQSSGPIVKGPYELASSKAVFPDVLEQRTIPKSERWWRFMGTMTDDRAVNWLRQVFDQDYYAPGANEQLQQMILQVRRRDPEQWAYYEAREAAADWKEKTTGKRFEAGSYDAPEAQALRNFRRAIYRADVAAAEHFYKRLLDYGYTSERFDASLRAQHPLSDLNREQRREYESGLDARRRRELALALQYYERIAAFDRRERALFPRERAVRAGAQRQPNTELLRQILQR